MPKPEKRSGKPRLQRSWTAPTPSPDPKVYGYCRVSSVRQAAEGESLEAQKRQLRGYAMMHGLTLSRVFVEKGVSGSKPLRERPQGAALIASIAPGDVILTPKLDRMFRSARDALDLLAELKDRGISLHMLDLGGDVTGNGISKLVFTILAAVSEAERDRIKERVFDVKQSQKAQGHYLGGTVPFGWRKVERQGKAVLQEVAEEQRAIARMRKLRAKGMSLRAIALQMLQAGFTLSHVGVKRVLGE